MTKISIKNKRNFLPEGENKFQSGGEKKRREGRKELDSTNNYQKLTNGEL